MKVYRNNIFDIKHPNEVPVMMSDSDWVNLQGDKVSLNPLQNLVIHTGSAFEETTITSEIILQASSYYVFDGTVEVTENNETTVYANWRNISDIEVLQYGRLEIFNIMEGTYTGKDMGERSITATIDFPAPIDFQIGDYVEYDLATLIRGEGVEGGHDIERFYIYTMPTIKKVASKMSYGKAFQHTVTFYPRQYELGATQMRDLIQEVSSGIIYTGYDEFSFFGGAHTLLKRIKAVLDERFGTDGEAGKDHWSYMIADDVNEDKNTALERFQFDFSGESVLDALLKLNDKNGINTTFFINERMIYVGYKRPYICGVDNANVLRTVPFLFKYGKTSHLPIETNYGNLFTITKSVGSASPITRLYAYGADRNLHRFYCSDRIKSGRYIKKLMLPSFSDDGRTDYIDSPEGIAKFGIREGSKTFDEIYPSLRYFTYGDVRKVKYCIKLMGCGCESDAEGTYDTPMTFIYSALNQEQRDILESNKYIKRGNKKYFLTTDEIAVLKEKGEVTINNIEYPYPVARIQCYKVEPLVVNNQETMVNHLVPCAPPKDIAVFCHATGKVVKCVLYGGATNAEALQKQIAADGTWSNGNGRVPALTYKGNDYIPGSCFAVHDALPGEVDEHFGCGHTHGKYLNGKYDESGSILTRDDWFINPDTIDTSSSLEDPDAKSAEVNAKVKYKTEISIHQINYTDTHWITDVFEFEGYHQETFVRDGYSAYCWPRVNSNFHKSDNDNIQLNEVIDVGKVTIEDTDLNLMTSEPHQSWFDVYIRDIGFKINEQSWFGDYVFLFDTCTINFLDGNLGGCSFEVLKESDESVMADNIVCALLEDGTINDEFFRGAWDPIQARNAFYEGAYWRIRCKRTDTEVDNYFLPNVNVNGSAGDHIVFLDIFMPDIYIRVAEQRLLREAKKYLDANDDGDIQYALELDKVRFQKTSLFALQMREGAVMRIVDEDLNVATDNEVRVLFLNPNGKYFENQLKENVFDREFNPQRYRIDNTHTGILQERTYGIYIKYDNLMGKAYAYPKSPDAVNITNENIAQRFHSYYYKVSSDNLYDTENDVYINAYGELVVYVYPEQLEYYEGDPEFGIYTQEYMQTHESKQAMMFTYGEKVIRIKFTENFVRLSYLDDKGFPIDKPFKLAERTVVIDPYVISVEWVPLRQAYRVVCQMSPELTPTIIPENVVDETVPDHNATVEQNLEWTLENLKPSYVFTVMPYFKIERDTPEQLWGGYELLRTTDVFNFKVGKRYEVVLDVDNVDEWWTSPQMMCLVSGYGNGIVYYMPEYVSEAVDMTQVYSATGERGYYRRTFEFELPESFNDKHDYAVALQYNVKYIQGVDMSSVRMRLVSITEKNTESIDGVSNYVDLGIESVTIKFHDNTRESGVQLQNGIEPSRLIDNEVSAMYREVTATIKEETRASSWSQVQNRLQETEKLSDQSIRSYQAIVQAARHNYRQLLSLKNTIFDPDGSCDQTFLQVMMLQVGADSMNFRLLKTHMGINGVLENCDIVADANSEYFIVNGSDTLEHYVYTEDNHVGGKWYVPGGFEQELEPIVDEDTGDIIEYPTYFIAIKCARNNSTQGCTWVCETTQHSVNEDDEYYYFNWGILVADSEGHYSLTETRGNAYMYGDNLVCGQISSLAKNCYFDLTHGDFVLSEFGKDQNGEYHDGMTYIDGKLTIYGLNDAAGIGKIINDLGEIGGENLCTLDKNYYEEWSGAEGNDIDRTLPLTRLISKTNLGVETYEQLPIGTYTVSFKEARMWQVGYWQEERELDMITRRISIVDENNHILANLLGDNNSIIFTLNSPTVVYLQYFGEIVVPDSSMDDFEDYESSMVYVSIKDLMIQRGTKATTYQEYVQHLTNALQGSTEIAGGLTMTNLLMLKDEGDPDNGMKPKVTAGMSGLTDNILMWGGATYMQALWAALHNYQLEENSEDNITTLLKKDGSGKIGCFRIIGKNTVSITSYDGTSEIIMSAGENAQDTNIKILQNGVVKVLISGDEINRNTISGITKRGALTPQNWNDWGITDTNQTIIIDRIDLSQGTGGWNVNFEANKIIIKFALPGSPNQLPTGVKGYFEIHVCGHVICSKKYFEKTGLSYNSSVPQYIIYSVDISKFTTTTSELHNIEVRLEDMQVLRNGTWGETFGGQLYLNSIRFCNKTGTGNNESTDFTDADVNFSNISSNDIVQIGSNGVQVSHANGGFIQMLNDDNELYVRMFGLPNAASPTEAGKLYEDNGFLKISNPSI